MLPEGEFLKALDAMIKGLGREVARKMNEVEVDRLAPKTKKLQFLLVQADFVPGLLEFLGGFLLGGRFLGRGRRLTGWALGEKET